MRERLRDRQCLLRSHCRQSKQRVSELPAGRERCGVEQRWERNELRLGAGLQRSELRVGLLHRGDGLPVKHSQPEQCVSELPAGCKYDDME